MKSYAPPKLRQIVTEAVFRRRRIFVLTIVTVVGLVAALTLLMHKKCRAEAKLMVQNVRPLTPLSTSANNQTISQNEVSPEEVNSEVNLLQSRAVMQRTLQDDLTGLPSAEKDLRIANLTRRLSVDAVHQTNLIDLSFIANSP